MEHEVTVRVDEDGLVHVCVWRHGTLFPINPVYAMLLTRDEAALLKEKLPE